MRIIDKNQDFYDYLQDPTDNQIVFDRRKSFLLTKERICDEIIFYQRGEAHDMRFLLLQCGAAYWLILLTITSWDKSYAWDKPTQYELEVLAKWKNFDKPRKIIDLSVVKFNFGIMSRFYKGNNYFEDIKNGYIGKAVHENTDTLVKAIDTNDFRTEIDFNKSKISRSTKTGFDETVYDIPQLKACGIAQVVDPVDIFTAIEEHFSLLRTESERTEPLGITNDDKITMHGFDTKTSFRGKT